MGRYKALFDECRNQAEKPQNKLIPIILLLVDPHNPSAIGMTKAEEALLYELMNDCPNISIVHDIAYLGYHVDTRDSSKPWRDHGMPHPKQSYIGIMSTSKSV